jgi:PHD/YefM family antitoxin component YafN of YafNO toxin-antitoxin module
MTENILSVTELDRRGMAAIEEALRRGPVHIVSQDKPTAVVLSEDAYRQLLGRKRETSEKPSAFEWLLEQQTTNARDKAEIDASFAAERAW